MPPWSGFFIDSDWGSWQGGELHDDGFTYYMAEGGRAKGTLVAGMKTGQTEIIVRSKDLDKRIQVTFDYGTLTVFPNVIVLDTEEGGGSHVYARGGLLPIEWWTSHPDSLYFGIVSGSQGAEISLYFIDATKPLTSGTLPTGGGTLYALDSEGQVATAQVYAINRGCSAATLTVAPSSGDFSLGVSVVITVNDTDRAGDATVTVTTSPNSNLNTGTLTASGSAGLFTGNPVFTTSGGAGTYQIIYTDQDHPDNNCQALTVTADLVNL